MPPIVNQKEIRNKAFVMSTIMSDSKLAKIMNDAWNSPAGSTKNKKARSILRSLGASHKNYSSTMDGMGGQPNVPNPLQAYTQRSSSKSAPPQGAPVTSQAAQITAQVPQIAPQVAAMKPADDPTIPNITAEQVKSAFNSFGYEPDIENMNDTGYWMTKPSTDMGKLMEELRKRRIEENARLKENNEKVMEESRLSPERIRQMYDSFGLGEQVQSNEDIAKIQSVLPNSEKALAKVLETEQKRKIGEYKEKLLPTVKKDGKGGCGPQDGKGGANPLQDLIDRQKIPYNPSELPAVGTSPMVSSVNSHYSDPSTLPFNNTNQQNTTTTAPLGPLGLPNVEGSRKMINPTTGLMEDVPIGISPRDMGWLPYEQDRKKTPTQAVTVPTELGTYKDVNGNIVGKNDAPGTIHEFADGTYTYVNRDGSVHTGKKNDNYIDITVTPSVSGDVTDNASDTGDTTPLSYGEQYTRDALDAGEGPLAFGLKLLGNRAELAKTLGMPESEIAKFWPENSPLLAAQLPGLRAAAEKEAGLGIAEQQIMNALSRNLNIEDNISAYIRGKDEYLGQIDKLIDDTVTLAANTDTSNPNTAKQLSNYMNYLTILQGRQNNRYINMLDIAVKQDNNNYKIAESQYNIAFNKAKTLFDDSTAVTTEFYNNTLGLINEMYNNVAGRGELMDEVLKKEFEMSNLELDNMKKFSETLMKMKEAGLPTYGVLSAQYPDATDEQLAQLDAGLSGANSLNKIPNLSTADSLMGITVNDGGYEFLDYNPLSAVTSALSQGGDRDTLFKRYSLFTGDHLYNKSSTGDFISELSYFGPGLSEMSSLAETNPDILNPYIDLLNNIESKTTKGLIQFLSNKRSEVKSAIEDLTGIGIWGKGETDKTKFVNKHSELGDVAGLLFDLNQLAMSDPNKNLNPKLVDDDKLFTQLSQDLADMALLNLSNI